MVIQLSPKALARFESRFEKGSPDQCWNWRAGCDKDGYGAFSVGSRGAARGLRAHRIAYVLANGPIPEGGHVLHRCDNPACVNPAHLYLGDNAANMRDRKNAGHYAEGEANPATTLTDDQVRQIRQLYRPGRFGFQRLGEQFGVSTTTVQRIIKRATWTHLPEEGATSPERRPEGYSAKLTKDDVAAIRAAYAQGDISQSELARRWGVTQAAIWSIVRGKTWPLSDA